MKQFLMIGGLILLATNFSQAQKRPIQERIEAMRSAFITDYLELSPQEAQAFWPLYNEYQAKEKTIRNQFQVTGNIRTMTDQEAEKVVLNELEREEQMLALKREYYRKLQKAVPVRKIALLSEAERKFKEKLLEEIQKRRNSPGPQRPGGFNN